MGNNKNDATSRRDFFSLFLSSGKKAGNPEMVKMLTAEGKLVEISKAVLEEASKKQKSTNKEIFDWMKNPSKKK